MNILIASGPSLHNIYVLQRKVCYFLFCFG